MVKYLKQSVVSEKNRNSMLNVDEDNPDNRLVNKLQMHLRSGDKKNRKGP